MPTSARFVLLGAANCHLCEQAEELVAHCLADDQFYYQDIHQDEALARQYGWSIPVFKHLESGDTLNWPFDLYGLEQFISSY